MTICKNCTHWTRHDIVRWDGPKATIVGKHEYLGDCACPKFVYTVAEGDTPRDGLGYDDAECYAASFETGEGFGCVHGVARGKETT